MSENENIVPKDEINGPEVFGRTMNVPSGRVEKMVYKPENPSIVDNQGNPDDSGVVPTDQGENK